MRLKEISKQLQHDLAQIDLLFESINAQSQNATEFLLVKLKDMNIKLKMYQEQGHAMPHLHIDYGKNHHIASFSIKPLPERIEGSLPAKYDSKIIEWITKNNNVLLDIWREAQAGGDPNSIVAQLKGNK